MKKLSLLFLSLLTVSVFAFSACGTQTPATDEGTEATKAELTEPAEEPVIEEVTGPVPFSEIDMDIMDASDVYSITFAEGEGDCIDKGFPAEFMYTDSIVKTEDESLLDDWVSVDFTGRLSLIEFDIDEVEANCSVKTTTGANKAVLTCSVDAEEEGADDKELCTGTFKMTAEKY